MTAIILIATKVSYQKHFPIRIYAGGLGHYVQITMCKSQNFKNHDFGPFEKNYSFLPNLASFYRIF